MRKIRVLIVEHHALLRDGLLLLIQGSPTLKSGARPGPVRKPSNYSSSAPDVTLMDLDLPASAGTTVVRRILKRDPSACVLGLLAHEEDVIRERAMRAGARSCITKGRLNQDLVVLIQDCARHPN